MSTQAVLKSIPAAEVHSVTSIFRSLRYTVEKAKALFEKTEKGHVFRSNDPVIQLRQAFQQGLDQLKALSDAGVIKKGSPSSTTEEIETLKSDLYDLQLFCSDMKYSDHGNFVDLYSIFAACEIVAFLEQVYGGCKIATLEKFQTYQISDL
jgi:hypothetical protein